MCSWPFITVQRLLPAQGKRGRSPLDQSSLGEAGDVAASDDQVIKHADVDERQRLAQALRDEFVRLARLRDAARVVVAQDHRGGVPGEHRNAPLSLLCCGPANTSMYSRSPHAAHP